MKYIESNIPEQYTVRVHYLHDGNTNVYGRAFVNEQGHMQFSKYTTIAELVDKTTGKRKAFGVAHCGKKDLPNRHLGRHIAVGRAMKNLGAKRCS